MSALSWILVGWASCCGRVTKISALIIFSMILGRSTLAVANHKYTKYAHYPKYCSTPDEMATRQIPPLLKDSKAGDSRLLHVSAIVRHGARTLWTSPSPNQTCWEGYNPVWDCNLTTWIGTPPRVDENDGSSSPNMAGMFLMNKLYTALHEPEINLTNFWGGSCQRGQLLMQGYDQELRNGQFLRDAYVYQGENDFDHDERMRLLDATTVLNDDTLQSQLYYRADDDQRTLMSGQIILRGLLQDELNQYFINHNQHPILPLYTADRVRDILDPNFALCPRLQEIEDRYVKSKEYQSFLESAERKVLMDFKEHVLGVTGGADMLGGAKMVDCLMTAICTDRYLPDALNDYDGEDMGGGDYYPNITGTPTSSTEEGIGGNESSTNYGEHVFQRLGQLEARPVNLVNLADDNEFAKVAMSPLWREIMYHIKAAYVTDSAAIIKNDKDPFPAKLALFSGHDSTIMPLLASIGAWKIEDWWPPYASMVVIEIHELNFDGKTDMTVYPTNYAFRLIYNGQVWTSRVQGCPEDEHLCNLDVLLHVVTPLLDRDCELNFPAPQAYSDPVQQAQEILKTQGGQYAMGAVAVASFVAGILFTTMCVCCCCSPSSGRSAKRRQLVSTLEEGEGDGIVMGVRGNYRDEDGDLSGVGNNNHLGSEEGLMT